MMHSIVQKKEFILLGGLSVVFFVVSLFLYIDLPRPTLFLNNDGKPGQIILNQPDESSNYFFLRQFVLEHRFTAPEPLSSVAFDQVHPRSTTVVGGNITPIGFPGIIVLFGTILKAGVALFGTQFFNLFAVCLTPLVAAITPLLVYGSLKKLFDRRIALVSSVLMYILPAWWYYAARAFQHNTLFVGLLIGSLFFFSFFLEQKKVGTLKTFFLGLTAGLAIYVRPSEAVWVSGLCLALFIFSYTKWTKREMLAAAIGVLLTGILFFLTQTWYYGHPFGSGYVVPTNGSSGLLSDGPQGISLWKGIIAPFGFHPRILAKNAWLYLGVLFLPWALVALGGLVPWLKRFTISKQRQRYLLVYGAISIYLLIYYGSWGFFDNLAGKASIGSSHVRYFLPIYVGALPFVAECFISMYTQKYRVVKIFAMFIFVFLFSGSYLSVFSSFEGLQSIKHTVRRYYVWQERLYRQTEDEAILITRYADKYLFPKRKVLPAVPSVVGYQAVDGLINQGYPLYWYDLKSDEGYLRRVKDDLSVYGLALSEPVDAWEDIELRRVEKIHQVR